TLPARARSSGRAHRAGARGRHRPRPGPRRRGRLGDRPDRHPRGARTPHRGEGIDRARRDLPHPHRRERAVRPGPLGRGRSHPSDPGRHPDGRPRRGRPRERRSRRHGEVRGPPDTVPRSRRRAPMIRLDSIDAALAALRDRRPVVVVDDEDRENEGDLIMPAVSMTPAWMGFMIRHTSGVVCAPMPGARARALDLPPMTQVNEDAKGTAYTLTCDAAAGITTGISAADRTTTVHTLAAAAPDPASITRPGHVLPLVARDGGVRERPGHTEAGVELCRLVDRGEVAVIAEHVHDDGPMMRGRDLRTFADAHDLPLVSIADLIVHLDARDGGAVTTVEEDDAPTAPEVVGTAPVALPTPQGTFLTRAWRELDSEGRPGIEHLTLETPTPSAEAPSAGGSAGPSPHETSSPEAPSAEAPLVRVHSECLTG